MFIASLIALLLFSVPTPLTGPDVVEAQGLATTTPLVVATSSTPVIENDDDIVACNCYLEVKSIIPNLPHTKDLVPNSPARAGAVAIYNYHGIPHYAYVESVVNDGTYGHWERGSNLKHCKFYERFVDEENPYLIGYWYEPTSIALASP